MEGLTIGELSARSGLAPSALRFYESEGLLPATRTAGGQRRYPRSALRRLAFVRAAQRVGLTLDEVREALASLPDGRTPDGGRLATALGAVAAPPGRAHRRAGAAAGQPHVLHRLRLPVAAALRALQPR